MNDYKVLISDLDVWMKDAENSELTPPNVLRKCKYAIERLAADRTELRNELCCRCGQYAEAHNGACDGCKWRDG